LSIGKDGQFTPAGFREFCKEAVTTEACKAAFLATQEQRESRQWQILRYGRISASTIHEASRSKIPTGGVLKEKIMGAATLKLTSAMKRGQDLEEPISGVVSKKLNVKIQKVGIQLSPEYPEFGASPDGLCDEAVIEIKSPSNEKTFKHYVSD